MDACIFVLTVNALTPVYMSDRATEFADLHAGDKVCVMEILPAEWMRVHWSSSNVGHTGFLHGATARKEAEPTAPTPYEERETPAPPAPPPPAPPPPPPDESDMPPPVTMPAPPRRAMPPVAMPPGEGPMMTPQRRPIPQRRPMPPGDGPMAPRNLRPASLPRQPYPGEPRLPRVLVMTCEPAGGTPYAVFFEDGSRTVTVSGSRVTRDYYVIDRRVSSGHTLYITATDQDITLFLAFDYSKINSDVSAIRVADAKDKCFMDWGQTAYE